MDNRHLWIRSKKQHAVLKIRHTVIKAVRDYFDNERIYARRHADLYACRVRRHDDAF